MRGKKIYAALLVLLMCLTTIIPKVPVAAAPTVGTVTATDLRTEYVVNPMGIDVEKPRFSWTLASDERGVVQQSYRIYVATSEEDLEDGPYVWESPEENSDSTLNVYYDGPDLEATTRYYWKVLSKTNKGDAVCDTGAYFETGFMDSTMTPWGDAKWITKKPYAWEDTYNYTIEYDFRIKNNASGFIFGSKDNCFLMWQFNIQAGKNNVPADGTPTYRPHAWTPGGAELTHIVMKDGVIPNTPEGKAAWYTCKIEVAREGDQSYATTSLKAAGDTAFTQIEERRALPNNGTEGKPVWPLGRIGFRTNGTDAEASDFTNIKIWDNSDSGKLMYEENFEQTSSLFPNETLQNDGQESTHPDTSTYTNMTRREEVYSDKKVKELQLPENINNDPLFRKDFTTKNKEIKSARLYATARGYYEFAINGEKVGDQYLAPGWTDYFHTIMYQTYDVTDMLNANGENAIGAMTAKGWYSGPHQMVGGNYNLYGNVQSVLGKLVITYEDGSQDVVGTGDDWNFTYGPITYADNYRGEGYDARYDHEGWNDVGYTEDPNDWSAALVVDPPSATTIPASGGNPAVDLPAAEIVGQVEPPIQEVRRFKDEIVNVTPEKYPDRLTYNITQNIAGFISIKVKGEAGAKLTIKHAEMLNTDTAYSEDGVTVGGGDGPPGTIFRAALRDAYAGGNKVAVDTYILKGDENGEEWTPRFTFHGFQYFEITGDLENVEIEELQAIAISSNNEKLSEFESSHAKVNKLFSNINWGMLGNQVGVPTDCPNRDERLGYTGDTQMFSRTATYLQNNDAFYSRWLRDLRSYQSTQTGERTGLVPMVIPTNPKEDNFSNNWGAAWGDAATVVPWHVYQQYGDTQIIKDSYDSMKAWCDFLYSTPNTEDNLRRQSSGAHGLWNLGDWVNMDGSMPDDYKVITNSLFMAHSHNLFAKMARVIGDPEGVADAYEQRAKDITAAVKASYFNLPGYENKLTHADGDTRRERQTAYAMMLYYNLDEENNDLYAKRLAAIIDDNGGRLGTGFVGVAYLTPALSANGQSDTAFTLLEQEAFPSWIYSINQGATTTWERWNSFTTEGGFDTSGMNSFNHYTFGSVGEWMMSGVLGIDRDENDASNAGFHKFVLNPQYGGTINYAKGEYRSVSGTIKSDWTWEDDGKFEYKFTVPANTTATVYIPSIDKNSVVSEGNTANAEDAEGVTFKEYDAKNKRAVYEVESGSYEFTSTTIKTTKKVEVAANPVENLYGSKITAEISAEGVNETKTAIANRSASATFSVPYGAKVVFEAKPVNTAEFEFTGWTDADGKTLSENSRFVIDEIKDNYSGIRANFKRSVTYKNRLFGSDITTMNEHANSGDWSRANLVNGNLIGKSGDNGWSSSPVDENPVGTSRPQITFDMKQAKSIDRIHMYPRTDSLTASGNSPFFPRRFIVELANNSDFSDAVAAVDYSNEDYKILGAGEPAVFELDQVYNCRYMRITGIKMGEKPTDDTVFRMQFKQIGAYLNGAVAVDTTQADALILEADKLVEKDYTKVTWASYVKAREDVQDILEEIEASGEEAGPSQKQLDEAVALLQDAMDALKTPTQTAKAEALILEADKLAEKDYTPDSWASFAKAREEVQDILAVIAASEDEIGPGQKTLDDAVVRLQQAIDALRAAEPTPPVKVQVSSIVITPAAVRLESGKSKKLTADILPKEATNKNVVWTSSNPRVATVSADGTVKALKAGTADITATAADGSGKKAKSRVTVFASVTSVKLPQSTLNLVRKKSATVKAVVKTTDGSKAKVTWKSSKPKVAAVNSKGKITAKAKGTAIITAQAENGKKAKLRVRVVTKAVAVKSVSIKSASKKMKVGQARQLKAKVTPSSATGAVVSWKSSKSSVVAVTADGRITAKKAGKATITLKAGRKSAKVVITVKGTSKKK